MAPLLLKLFLRSYFVIPGARPAWVSSREGSPGTDTVHHEWFDLTNQLSTGACCKIHPLSRSWFQLAFPVRFFCLMGGCYADVIQNAAGVAIRVIALFIMGWVKTFHGQAAWRLKLSFVNVWNTHSKNRWAFVWLSKWWRRKALFKKWSHWAFTLSNLTELPMEITDIK